MSLEGFLATQAGQGFQVVAANGEVGGFQPVAVDMHGQLGHVPAALNETESHSST